METNNKQQLSADQVEEFNRNRLIQILMENNQYTREEILNMYQVLILENRHKFKITIDNDVYLIDTNKIQGNITTLDVYIKEDRSNIYLESISFINKESYEEFVNKLLFTAFTNSINIKDKTKYFTKLMVQELFKFK